MIDIDNCPEHLYKFIQMDNEKYFNRVIKTIKTNKFWFSKFSDFNDPMEGFFMTHNRNINTILFREKMNYRIGSFTTNIGARSLEFWNSYTNGMKGVLLRIKTDKEIIEENYLKIAEVIYCEAEELIKEIDNNVSAIDILSRKLKSFEYEKEIRFFLPVDKVSKRSKDDNLVCIGEVDKVLIGDPYGGLSNTSGIEKFSDVLGDYKKFVAELEAFLDKKKIDHDVLTGKMFLMQMPLVEEKINRNVNT